MPQVAFNNATIQESSKSNHVSYTERYQSGTGGGGADSEGNSIPTYPIYSNANHNSNAKITGKVNSSHNVLVNGVSVVTVGDPTQEQWVADPTPYPHYNGGTITSITPGTSGSGSGSVKVGSPNVFVNGKALAYKGSQVTTYLGTNSSISSGSSSNVTVN